VTLHPSCQLTVLMDTKFMTTPETEQCHLVNLHKYNHQTSPFYTNLLVIAGIDFTLDHCGLSISCNKQVLEKHHEKHQYIILWHKLESSWNHKNDNNIWMGSCDWVVTVAGRRWDCLLAEGIPSVVVWAAAIPLSRLVGPALEVGSLNQEPVPNFFNSYNSSIRLHWLLKCACWNLATIGFKPHCFNNIKSYRHYCIWESQ
jgi:hypothetical protein